MMLAQFSWARVAEMAVVVAPVVGIPLCMMVVYLRSLRSDVKRSIGELHERIDKIDARLGTVEEHKVGRREHVLKVARTSGKMDKMWDRLGELIEVTHELKGRLDGEMGVGRRIDAVGNKVVAALARKEPT